MQISPFWVSMLPCIYNDISRAVTWVLRLGDVWACFIQPKRHGESHAQQTFQSLINISFPKIVGTGGGWEKNFGPTILFSPKFFSNIFVIFHNCLLDCIFEWLSNLTVLMYHFCLCFSHFRLDVVIDATKLVKYLVRSCPLLVKLTTFPLWYCFTI
jgi:hypothetical protein